jgi:serine protease Do
MSLHRRFLLALGALPVLFLVGAASPAQETTSRTSIAIPELRAPDPRAHDPFPRTGTRRTAIVQAVQRVKDSVVNIHSERTVTSGGDLYALAPSQNRVNGMGTGVIIDPRGYIVTNHHVVEDVTLLRTRLADGTTQNAVVVARNHEMDLALIKIEPPYPLPVMPLGTAMDLMVGETVIAVGNAYGYEHTVSVGIVSAVKRDVSLNKDMSYKALIQTDASINPGNSGGPLVNVNGELVGINVAIRAGAQGIGFAIPVDHMIRSVGDMLRSQRRRGNYDGLVCRDRVDVSAETPVRTVVVERAEPNSPAAAAGLKPGDELVRLGDVAIQCSFDVERALLERRGGETLPALVRRGAQEQRCDLVLAGASGERVVRAAPPAPAPDVIWTKLGLRLTTVAPESVSRVNRQLNGGLEVTDLGADGTAAKAGIKKGDILVGLHQWETLSLDNVTYVLNHPELQTFNPLSFYVLRGGQVRKGTISNVN